MLWPSMMYTVRQLARSAGVSVRTLHYYDRIGLLKPTAYGANRYRMYGDEAILLLQQILFFRELGFSLRDIGNLVSQPEFDLGNALRTHRVLLLKKAGRIQQLVETIDRTIRSLQGDIDMEIKEYYQGFSDAQIDEYRKEVRERWGEDVLRDSETRVLKMGRERMAAVQAEGNAIFETLAALIPMGPGDPDVQEQIARWKDWLEHFATYSDEALLGLGRMYSEDSRFAEFYRKFHVDLPAFFTAAVEHYCANKEGGKQE